MRPRAKRTTRAMRRFLDKGVNVMVEEEEEESERREMCGKTAMIDIFVLNECGGQSEPGERMCGLMLKRSW